MKMSHYDSFSFWKNDAIIKPSKIHNIISKNSTPELKEGNITKIEPTVNPIIPENVDI